MSLSANTIDALFTEPLEHVETLPLEEETALIAAAQAGDEGAKDLLLRQYAPALRGLVAAFVRASGVESDEARSTVLLTFATVLDAAQASERVAFRLNMRAVLETASAYDLPGGTLTVPARTRQKVYQALRAAGRDGAEDYAVETLGMARDTFRDALAAMAYSSTDEEGADEPRAATHGFASAETVDEVARLLRHLSPEERDVVTVAYLSDRLDPETLPADFWEYQKEDSTYSDAGVAAVLGMSRSAAQRVRTAALLAMHDAACPTPDLGVLDPRCERATSHVAEVAA